MAEDRQAVTPHEAPPPGARSEVDWTLVALALGTGSVVLALGTSIESLAIRALRPSGRSLEWLSDVLAAIAVSGMTYLWLHLRAARSRLLDLERAQIVVDEQLRLAAEIQRGLLPPIPKATPGFRWAARMVAAHQVGGDFYDFVRRPDGAVLVLVGDVSGKGIAAAMLQSSLKALFRVHCSQTDDPALIGARISADLHAETGGIPYATAIVARFQSAPPRLVYSNAGHPAGLVLRGESAIELEAGGPPLGLLPGSRYSSGEIPLGDGDIGVLVSDGVSEALEGVPQTLLEALRDACRVRSPSPSELCDHLMHLAGEAPGPPGAGAWQDDRTVFAFTLDQDR